MREKIKMLILLLFAGLRLVSGDDHEIVYPRMIVSRSGQKRVLFRAFDQDFHLRLEPTDILADEFVVLTRDDKGNEVSLKPDTQYWHQRILQDRDAGSTIAVDDEGALRISGIINEELRIEPALEQGVANRDSAEGRRQEGAHRVIKVSQRANGGFFDEVIPPGHKPIDTNYSDTEERQSGLLSIETGIVEQLDHSLRVGSDAKSIEYFAIMFNCVCLRYSKMKNIQVRFKLVGIKRNLLTGDEPYVTNNLYKGHALSEPLLSSFGSYCVEKAIFPTADIIMLVTKLPMGDMEPGSDQPNPGVIGIAYVGGSCDKRYKVGVSEDDGYQFSGCSTIAHENAHLLGCPHDGDGAPSYLSGSPGAKACPWDDGYMMSYVSKDTRQFIFSKCSEECIQYLAKIASCMTVQNVKTSFSAVDSRLPGQYFTATQGSSNRDSYYNDRCKQYRSDLFLLKAPESGCTFSCRSPTANGMYYYWSLNCLDGDQCATGKICRNGICEAI